jgi:membrane-associated protease RseP (regulator of RpoE activity)
MINLIPAGQLDGGHIAYALFGTRQNAIAKVVHRSMLALFFVSLGSYVYRDVQAGFGLHRIGTHVWNSVFWLIWFELIGILGSLRPDEDDEKDPARLSWRTRVLGIVGLALLADFGRRHGSSLLWAAWFVGLAVLLAMEVRGGALRAHSLTDHPATDAEPLGGVRTAIAVLTLIFFALLFMPVPISL